MSEEDTVICPVVVTASQPESVIDNARLSNQDIAHRGRGGTYFHTKLLSLFTVMERVFPISPVEWESVVVEHSNEFPGCDVYLSQLHNLVPEEDTHGGPQYTYEDEDGKKG